jgi:streptomycin 6-kinase
VSVPAVVRNKALAAGAARWLDDLPRLIASLERDWQITVGRPFPDATEAFVAEAVPSADAVPSGDAGPSSVLKLMIPRAGDHARNEITVLRMADGDGCARLLRADEARGALLLERLGRPLAQLGRPLARRHEILCATAARLWRPAPASGLPTGADKGRWLSEFITATWLELDRPCPERAVGHALCTGTCTSGTRSRRPPTWSRASSWSTRTACSPRPNTTWASSCARTPSTGLLCTRIGLQPVGREMLATADYVSRY